MQRTQELSSKENENAGKPFVFYIPEQNQYVLTCYFNCLLLTPARMNYAILLLDLLGEKPIRNYI